MTGLCLDAGALIAIERDSKGARELILRALEGGSRVDVTAGALAQAWRGGSRQARLATFLKSVDVKVIPLEEQDARAIGVMCARRGATDVVDAHVAWHALSEGLAVLTSDPEDIAKFGPLEIITIR